MGSHETLAPPETNGSAVESRPEVQETTRHPLLDSVSETIDLTYKLQAKYQPELSSYRLVVGRSIDPEVPIPLPQPPFRRSVAIPENLVGLGEDTESPAFGIAEDDNDGYLIIYTHDKVTGEPIAICDKLDPLKRWRHENIELIQDISDQVRIYAESLRKWPSRLVFSALRKIRQRRLPAAA